MILLSERKRKTLEYAALACVVGLLATVCVFAPYIGISLLWGVVGLAVVGVGGGLGGKLSAWLSGEDRFGFAVGAIFFGMATSVALAFVLPQAVMGLTILCGSLVVGGLLGGAIYKTFECILNVGEHSMKAIHQCNTHSKAERKSTSVLKENRDATLGLNFFKNVLNPTAIGKTPSIEPTKTPSIQ